MRARRTRRVRGFGRLFSFVVMATGGLAAALATGCDNDDAIPIEDLGAAIQTARCRSAIACGAATDQTACEVAFPVASYSDLNARVAAVKQGTIIYDGRKARACIDDELRECVQSPAEPTSCKELFRGAIADGAACHMSAECVSGQCAGACARACCLGSCVAVPVKVMVGDDCTSSGPSCVEGAYCQRGKCAAHLPFGVACTVGADVCAAPAHCMAGPTGATICVAPAAQGAACDVTGARCMRVDNYCDPATQLCVTRKAPGAACTDVDDECANLAPCIDGVCTPHPSLGQPCEMGGAVTCLGSLVCTDGVCATPPVRPECAL